MFRSVAVIQNASVALLRSVHRRRFAGRLVSLAIILNLLIWPAPGITLKSLEPASALASTVSSTVIGEVGLAFSELRSMPVVFVPLGPILLPLPVFPLWPFQSTGVARDLTMAERTARVSAISVSPRKYVGYIGDSITFDAMGTDSDGQPAHGAKFTWESSHEDKLTIDEAGRATLLGPGLVRVTARAGAIEKTASVLIRPIRRRMQTDQEWKDDQDSLVGNSGQTTTDGLVASLLKSLAPTVHAQGNSIGDYGNAATTDAVGTPPFGALEETRLGPVMPQTNFELPISLVSLGGRGLGTSLMAYYNSNTWGAYFDPARNGTVFVFDPIQSWPGPGFSLGFGRIVYYNGYTDANQVSWHSFMLIEPNGTRHNLGVGTDYGTNTLQTTDGSHITYVGNAATGGTLYYNDGTAATIGKVNNRLLPTQITDTNGNYIQIAYKWETNFPGIAINYIVDTLGRVIQFNYGQWPAPTSTSLSSITTPAGTITFGYQSVTMNYSFLTAVAVENAPASFYAVSNITIPARPTYSFSYSGYGMIYNTTVASQGGTASVTYNYPMGGEDLFGGPTFTQRTESPNATYSYSNWGDITRPDGTVLALSSTVRRLKNSSGQTLSKTEYAFTTDAGGSTVLQSAITTDEAGQQTKVDFDYDQYGNVINKREYGFKISGVWQARRRTHYNYVNWEPYLSSYIRNRATEVDVFDALQNTNDADDVLIGKSVYGYDSSWGGIEGYGGTANPPGHLSSYGTGFTARGNLTNVQTYTDVVTSAYVTHSNKTDIFGGVTLAQAACCDQKSFTLSEATYWSRASQTTNGDPLGIHLTSSAGYDFNVLTETSQTDPTNQTMAYTYDSAQRPTGFTSSTGLTGSMAYNAWGDAIASTVTWTEAGQNKTLTQAGVYDGWGQISQSIDVNGAQTNYTYDNMGRLLTQTNPFPQGGTSGPVITYQYDSLSRVMLVTLPGGNTIQTSYTNGSIVTVIDQVNRKTKRETDGLGRLIKLTEQDVATGALTQETTYSYDIADRLTGVNQGNQTRSFKYDAEGRMLFERIPEMTATINDGTGTYWSSKYTYTSFNAVATKTDARGVVTTFGYDALNRLTSISYNTGGAPGVAATPTVTYNFDTNQSSNTKGLLLSIAVGTSYSERYSYDGFKRMQSVTRTIDGRTYPTSYQRNAISNTIQLTYPSGRTLNAGYDANSRLASIGAVAGPAYISNLSYDINGNPTSWTLGNGVREGFSYDANRLQPTLHTAGTAAPYTNLINLSYSYQASAGQMGVGSSIGNAGQLTSVSGTISGTTESAVYAYDDLGRLVTSNQTSNASSAQRRFTYDRWGNRTAVWDATSGGNQIQAVTLQQSGGVPTNRIQSVTVGPTFTYTNDASGNVTKDGLHTYTYDGANRLVSIDGGSTATYSYDQQNRRVGKVSGGSSTHYVWEGSQIIAEHNGGTGAVIADYIYLGAKLIAKVTSGSTQYFMSDRMSARLVLDTSGNVLGRQSHLPFGEDFGETGSQEKHHFTSYERDNETANDYAINRVYSSLLGRFLSADPYSPKSSLSDPRGWNQYSYTRNVVINRSDPLGLFDGPIEGGCQPKPNGAYPGKCLCTILPQFCDGGPKPGYPPNVDGNSDGGRPEEESPFKGVTVSVSWKIPNSSKSPQGELATCGKFDLTVRIKNVPEGNPNNIFVSEVKAGNYPEGSIRRVGSESYRQEGKTIEYKATYQVGDIIGYQRTGNLGLKIILGARVKSGPDDPIRLVTTDVNRLGHDDDYIAIRGTIRGGRGGFKDCPN